MSGAQQVEHNIGRLTKDIATLFQFKDLVTVDKNLSIPAGAEDSIYLVSGVLDQDSISMIRNLKSKTN